MAATSPKVEAPKTPEPPDEAEGLRARIVGQISSHGFDMGPGFRLRAPAGYKGSKLTEGLIQELDEGKSTVQSLYRSYKHTPHAFPSLVAKYIVHRVNHADKYDHLESAEDSDQNFLKLHQHGGAGEHIGWVDIKTLHTALARNPHLVVGMMRHRDWLNNAILKGVGLNVRKIGNEHYVALCRGLDSATMTHEHALSSHADISDPGFGTHKHYTWAPLKDIWYSYDLGPEHPRGNFGPENEFLVSNLRTRYEAEEKDVKPNRLKNLAGKHFGIAGNITEKDDEGRTRVFFFDDKYGSIFDTATDDQIAADIPTATWFDPKVLSQLPNAGPKTYQALKQRMLPHEFEDVMHAPFVPGSAAIDYLIKSMQIQRRQGGTRHIVTGPRAFENPNLTESDLARYWEEHKKIFNHPTPPPWLLGSTRMTQHLAKKIFSELPDKEWTKPVDLTTALSKMSSENLEAVVPTILRKSTPPRARDILGMVMGKLTPRAIDELRSSDPDYNNFNWGTMAETIPLSDGLLDSWCNEDRDPESNARTRGYLRKAAQYNRRLTDSQLGKLAQKPFLAHPLSLRDNLPVAIQETLLDKSDAFVWINLSKKTRNRRVLSGALRRINENQDIDHFEHNDIRDYLKMMILYPDSTSQEIVRGVQGFLGHNVFERACSGVIDSDISPFAKKLADIVRTAAKTGVISSDGTIQRSPPDPHTMKDPTKHFLKPLPAGA